MKVSVLLRAGVSHLDLNSDDDGAELFVQLPQNHQLLQSQATQPADDTESSNTANDCGTDALQLR